MIGYVNAHPPHIDPDPRRMLIHHIDPDLRRSDGAPSSSTQLHAVHVRSLYVSDLAIVRTAPHTRHSVHSVAPGPPHTDAHSGCRVRYTLPCDSSRGSRRASPKPHLPIASSRDDID